MSKDRSMEFLGLCMFSGQASSSRSDNVRGFDYTRLNKEVNFTKRRVLLALKTHYAHKQIRYEV